jgi:hypothetical protein
MKSILAIIMLSCVGCVSATIEEPSICNTSHLGIIPAAPIANIQIQPVSFSIDVDFSSSLNKFSSVADQVNTTLNLLSLSSSSDLQWISNASISIKTNNLQDVPLGSYHNNGNDPGKVINFQIEMDADTLVKYMQQPATLTFIVSGLTTDQENDMIDTMCISTVGKVNKSL